VQKLHETKTEKPQLKPQLKLKNFKNQN